MLHSFHFIRPLWLFALIPLVIILWRLFSREFTSQNWQHACDPHLLRHLLTTSEETRNQLPVKLLSIGLLLAVLALTGPSWDRIAQPVYRSLESRVILLDLSPSMLAEDIKPNRLTRAKYKILDFLKKSRQGFTGMIAFASEPYVVSPLTQDTNTIAAMVPILSPNIMPVVGSNISAALSKADKLFKQGGVNQGQIILVTDGKANRKDIATVSKLAKHGIETSVLAIGTKEGAPIPKRNRGYVEYASGKIILAKLKPESLIQLAMAGNGRFVPFTNNDKDIHYLLGMEDGKLLPRTTKVKTTADLWRDQGRWLLLLLLPLAALAFRRGWL